MLAQHPFKELSHCKGFFCWALLLLLVWVGKYVLPADHMLFLLLSKICWRHRKVDGFRVMLSKGPGCWQYQRRMTVWSCFLKP